jgi:hypothetical protein
LYWIASPVARSLIQHGLACGQNRQLFFETKAAIAVALSTDTPSSCDQQQVVQQRWKQQ